MKPSSQLMMSLLAVVPLLAPAVLQAQEEPVYGRELMTDQELQEHRQTLRNLETAEERAEYRAEHREQMEERARERGVELAEPRSGTGAPGPAERGSGPGMMDQKESAEQRERMREMEEREQYRRQMPEQPMHRDRDGRRMPPDPLGHGDHRGRGGR